MSLEKRKNEAELMRVRAARYELEIKVEERLEEIQRLKDHILVQLNKEQELEKEIGG